MEILPISEMDAMYGDANTGYIKMRASMKDGKYEYRIQWLVARAKGKSIKQKCEFVMPPPVPEDEEPSAPTPRVPKQLSLFNLDEL